jgi:hypothetical protein
MSARRLFGVFTGCRTNFFPDALQLLVYADLAGHEIHIRPPQPRGFPYYNFGRIHQTLRVTPAIEAGVANYVWSTEEIVALIG